MGVKTRIGLMALVKSGFGSVELPEEVTLYCPQCGTRVADKGQCLLQFGVFPGESKTGCVARMVVDCRVCGCDGKEPGADW